jgi:protein TonB
VKRLWFATGLALGIHGLLFATEPEWLKGRPIQAPVSRVVTLTLAYKQVLREEPKPATKVPEISPKKIVSPAEKKRLESATDQKPPKQKPKTEEKVTKPRKPPKRVASPQKPIAKSLRPKKESLPKVISESNPQPRSAQFLGKEPSEVPERPRDFPSAAASDIKEEAVLKQADQMAAVPPATPLQEARPLYRRNPPPRYPRLAEKRGYEGTVVLEVLVDQRGKVGDLRVLSSSGYNVLDRAALAAVKDWSFEPASSGDEKVETWVKIPIRFQLN